LRRNNRAALWDDVELEIRAGVESPGEKFLNTSTVQICKLLDSADIRGHSFTVPTQALEFVGEIRDIHIASMLPNAIRGNHYHQRRREAIVIIHDGDCSVHWQEPASSEIHHQSLAKAGSHLVLIPAEISHAVRNDGSQELWIVALSSEPYEPYETVASKLI
jgi:dTDP-4-dehydrorhamnose 3,5-epimerase-like enzyme